MKRTLFALILLGLALALTSLHLVQQLRQEQAVVASLQGELAELRNTVQASTVLSQPAPDIADETVAPTHPPESTLPYSGVPAGLADAADADSLVDPPPMPGVGFRQNELLHDPHYRSALRQRNLLTLPRTMPGLREALGLSAEQATDLFELLADQQLESLAIAPSQLQPGQSREDTQRLVREERQRLDAQSQMQIRQLLGDQGFQQWQDYRASLGVRHQVEQVRTTLARRGVVMDEQLMPVLVRALADEQAAWAAQQQGTGVSGQASATVQPMIGRSAQAGPGVEQRLQARSQQHDRSFQTISPYLTGEQRRVLQEEQQASQALLESQMSLMRLQREAAMRRNDGD